MKIKIQVSQEDIDRSDRFPRSYESMNPISFAVLRWLKENRKSLKWWPTTAFVKRKKIAFFFQRAPYGLLDPKILGTCPLDWEASEALREWRSGEKMIPFQFPADIPDRLLFLPRESQG